MAGGSIVGRALLGAVLVLASTGCVENSSASVETPESSDGVTLPVTVVDETGAEITVESIERIIPLDGDVAEVVFALGLGDNVVATDLSATYPPEADALPEIGYQRALAAETVASFAPTVLLATDIAGPPEALDDMRRLGYPLVILPNEATPTGAGLKIRAVAAALGIPQRGEEMADALDAAIAEATVPPDYDGDRPRVVALYVRGTVAQLVLGESANTRWLINSAGGVDVSEEMGIDDNAPISAEAILAAAPDVLLVPEAGLESVGGVDGLLEIGGLGQTPAGLNRQVLAYDDQLLLGNGPRTAEMLARLRDDLGAVIVTAPTDPKEDS
ncbi:heme/hemin ABC transporter substrate-binding protein [Candidatus Poriferisocius sp.]|uniref:heme/hemin ABC transporter substrate-binding protein n=1 Tax=Candidatus Poriferisocius sp. TaxID=3101276 RepID=UPI003B012E72